MDQPVNPPVAPDSAIEDEASDWLSRHLAGPLTPSEQRAFMVWRNRSPAHLAAYRYAETTWQQLEAVGREPGLLRQDIAPLLRRPARPRLWQAVASLAAGIAVVVIGASLWFGNPLTLMRADYTAAVAQNRDVQLPDGSSVTLSPGAAIALDFTASERRVTLLGGSAYFTVAAQAADRGSRPFVVRGEDGSTRALGTQFAVAMKPAGIVVTVTEHAVEVIARSGSDGDRIVVSEGEAVSYRPDGSIVPLDTADVARTTAWHRGKLIFDRAPVSEIIVELNRYRRGRILVADPALADRRISGVFNTDDIDGAISAIARELKAEARLLPLLAVLY